MCDYSLEAYRSRPARESERYTLHRFPSGSKGFVSPGDCTTAVCMAPDTRLRLADLPQVCDLHGLQPVEEATFIRLDDEWYHDGLKFANGLEISLQRLPAGVTATIVESIDAPVLPLKVPALAD